MTEPLAPEQVERLLPMLPHLAEMVKKAGGLNRKALQVLLMGSGLEEDWALNELERWTKVLATAREASDAAEREMAQRALMLRGIPEAAAMLAVSVAAGGGKEEAPLPPRRLRASVERLDLGTLAPGQGATAEFEVEGGPGQIVAESDQVRVTPRRFGTGTTRVRVDVRPMQSGVLWTTLQLVTAEETLEVPLVARWVEPLPSAGPEPAIPPASELGAMPTINVLDEWVKLFSILTPTLAGLWVLPDLAAQGMERRLGRGRLEQVIVVDEERVLVIAGGGAGLFDLHSGGYVWEIDCPARCGALSPDGAILALGSIRDVYLWDVQAGRLLRRLEGHSDFVVSVAFSPDGRLLASGGVDKTVRLWEVGNGREVHRLERHSGSVTSVAFSPDGRLLASGSGDKTVRLWEVGNGREVHRLVGHTGSVESVAFSPDGRLLASGSEDGTVRIWRLR